MPKQLTELQNKFLDALFTEAKGNYSKAMRIAGYSETTNPYAIMQALRTEIIERAELEMAANLFSTPAILILSTSRFIVSLFALKNALLDAESGVIFI